MKSIAKMTLLTAMVSIAFSPLQAAPTKGELNGPLKIVKKSQKASFIYGDNLVTDVLLESDLPAAPVKESIKLRAEGLSSVMVTPNGDQFETKMNPKDLEVFENAIRALEKAGHSAALFTDKSVTPRDLKNIVDSALLMGDISAEKEGVQNSVSVVS